MATNILAISEKLCMLFQFYVIYSKGTFKMLVYFN